MAWTEMQYKVTGSAPLIMHNGQLADPLHPTVKEMKKVSGKRKKTDADLERLAELEFVGGLYLTRQDGPVIPQHVIDAAILGAAKKNREGPLAKAGCYCLAPMRLEYDGPRTANELWTDERFRFVRPVRVQSSRVMRTRPIFEEWHGVIRLNVETSVINIERVDDWMHIAGTMVGFCEWRPQYGRFAAERLSMNGHG